MEVSFVKPDAPIDVQAQVETVVNTDAPAGVVVESTTTIVAPVTPTPPVVDASPAAVIPTAPATPVTAVIVAPPVAVAAPSPVAFDDENIGFEDVILPRINIVQKVGDLSEVFHPGEIVLNQSQVIYEPAKFDGEGRVVKESSTGPLMLTVIGFRRRQFTEKVAGGKRGLLLNNEADVAKNDGTLDWNEWKESEKAAAAGTGKAKRYFERLATALCLIEKPSTVVDTDQVLFPYEFGGKFYALVLWSMKGVAYTHAAKPIFTWKKLGHMRTGYTAAAISLSTKMEKYGENYAATPIVKPAPKNSEEFRKFCREILGAGN